MYNKLFSKIVTSSVWLCPSEHRIVWITFLALMDQDGFVSMASVANLAHTARVPVESADAAVKAFESADPFAPEQEYQGRRIERIDGGWIVLNAEKYRSLATADQIREQTRKRVRAFRERQRSDDVTHGNAPVTQANANVTTSDSYSASTSEAPDKTKNGNGHVTDGNVTDDPDDHEAWERVKAAYPDFIHPQAHWLLAEREARQRIDEGDATWQEFEDGAKRYAAQCEAVQRSAQYVRSPKDFFAIPGRLWADPFPCPKKPETAMERIQRLNPRSEKAP